MRNAFRITLITMFLLIAYRCGSDKSTEPWSNRAPQISSFTVSPDVITTDDTCTIHVEAFDPEEGDVLSYNWSCDSGILINSTSHTVQWITPESGGEYVITCEVRDNWKSDVDSTTIVVHSLGNVSGYVYDEETGLPVPRAAVAVGSERDTTDFYGFFNFEKLIAGEYEVVVSGIRYAVYENLIDVTPGENEQEIRLSKSNTVTDVDGNVYETIVIGDQEWLVENLKVRHYNNGDAISSPDNPSEWLSSTEGAYCINGGTDSMAAIYGLLYNWYALEDSRGLAPKGWNLPTDEDWKELESYLGMEPFELDLVAFRGERTNIGGKLKEAGTEHWQAPNEGATNQSGFSALPGGDRHFHTANFATIGGSAGFWAATVRSYPEIYYRQLTRDYSSIVRGISSPLAGYSVRCVRK